MPGKHCARGQGLEPNSGGEELEPLALSPAGTYVPASLDAVVGGRHKCSGFVVSFQGTGEKESVLQKLIVALWRPIEVAPAPRNVEQLPLVI